MSDTPDRPGLSFELVTDDAAFAALGDAWAVLFGQLPDAPYFMSYDWMSAAWSQFARDNGHLLRVIVGRDGAGAVRLIWPLVAVPGGGARMLSSGKFENRDVLVETGAAGDRWIAQAWAFARQRIAVDIVECFGIRDDARLAPFLQRRDLGALRSAVEGICVDCTKFADWDAYFGQLSKSVRHAHRRRRRRLAEQGEIGFRVLTGAAEIEAAVDWMFDRKVEWLDAGKGAGYRSASYGGAEHRAFVKLSSCRAAATGNLFFGVLTLDGRYVGIVHAITNGRIMSFMYGAYDEACHRFSPGRLAVAEMIRWAFDRGIAQVDLLAGDMDYKYDWATDAYGMADYSVPCSRRGRLLVSWAGSSARRSLAALLIGIRLPGALEWRVDRVLGLGVNQLRVERARQAAGPRGRIAGDRRHH